MQSRGSARAAMVNPGLDIPSLYVHAGSEAWGVCNVNRRRGSKGGQRGWFSRSWGPMSVKVPFSAFSGCSEHTCWANMVCWDPVPSLRACAQHASRAVEACRTTVRDLCHALSMLLERTESRLIIKYVGAGQSGGRGQSSSNRPGGRTVLPRMRCEPASALCWSSCSCATAKCPTLLPSARRCACPGLCAWWLSRLCGCMLVT